MSIGALTLNCMLMAGCKRSISSLGHDVLANCLPAQAPVPQNYTGSGTFLLHVDYTRLSSSAAIMSLCDHETEWHSRTGHTTYLSGDCLRIGSRGQEHSIDFDTGYRTRLKESYDRQNRGCLGDGEWVVRRVNIHGRKPQ